MIDLAALSAYLTGRGTPLVLAAADAQLPPELRAFLAAVPGASLTLSPGPGGIAVAGNVLTVTGTASAAWPVQGFTGLTATLASAAVTVVNDPVAQSSTVSGTAVGTLPIPAAGGADVVCAANLASAVVDGYPAWQLAPAAETSPLTATDLLALAGGGGGVPLPVPTGAHRAGRRCRRPAGRVHDHLLSRDDVRPGARVHPYRAGCRLGARPLGARLRRPRRLRQPQAGQLRRRGHRAPDGRRRRRGRRRGHAGRHALDRVPQADRRRRLPRHRRAGAVGHRHGRRARRERPVRIPARPVRHRRLRRRDHRGAGRLRLEARSPCGAFRSSARWRSGRSASTSCSCCPTS